MYYLQDSNASIFFHEKAQRLSPMEIQEEYGFDFIKYLSDSEKSNPAINIFDKNNPIVMLKG